MKDNTDGASTVDRCWLLRLLRDSAPLISPLCWKIRRPKRKQFDDQMAPLKVTLIKYAASYLKSQSYTGKLSAPLSTSVRSSSGAPYGFFRPKP
jgi:hypothetical protein